MAFFVSQFLSVVIIKRKELVIKNPLCAYGLKTWVKVFEIDKFTDFELTHLGIISNKFALFSGNLENSRCPAV